MLLKKQGFPEENELVMCTVTNIHYHSVFAAIDEYDKTGMIHISEVSPGRIRNIRDFVKEGKKIVCKVLRINHEKGHIDLSLRRVNEGQRREKINELKQEQLAEKIIEIVAKKHKKDVKGLFENVYQALTKGDSTIFEAFEEVANEAADLEKLGIEKDIAKDLTEAIKLRIKPSEVEIGGDFTLSTFEPDGVTLIKQTLKKVREKEGVVIKYKGAGIYHIVVKASGYKEAEKILEEAKESALDFAEKNKVSAGFARMEK